MADHLPLYVYDECCLAGFQYHDGSLLALEWRPGHVSLEFGAVTGERTRLRGRGVRGFKAAGLVEGMIVGTIFVQLIAKMSEERFMQARAEIEDVSSRNPLDEPTRRGLFVMVDSAYGGGVAFVTESDTLEDALVAETLPAASIDL